MTCGIYGIVNQHRGNIYIGQAYDINKRWIRHKSELNLNKHHCKHLQNSWNKYEYSTFELIVLEKLEDYNQLTLSEQFWMDYFKFIGMNLYNVLPAKRSHLGIKRSEETKQKISISNSGKKRTAEIKQAISDRQFGSKRNPHSEETKQKMSLSSKGKKKSPEHAIKCREQLVKNRETCLKKVVETLSKQWTIECPNGNIITITNLTNFCREHKLNVACLHEVLKQKHGRTQHKGYKLPGR